MQVPENPERDSVALGHAAKQLPGLLLFERGVVDPSALEAAAIRGAAHSRNYEIARRASALAHAIACE